MSKYFWELACKQAECLVVTLKSRSLGFQLRSRHRDRTDSTTSLFSSRFRPNFTLYFLVRLALFNFCRSLSWFLALPPFFCHNFPVQAQGAEIVACWIVSGNSHSPLSLIYCLMLRLEPGVFGVFLGSVHCHQSKDTGKQAGFYNPII